MTKPSREKVLALLKEKGDMTSLQITTELYGEDHTNNDRNIVLTWLRSDVKYRIVKIKGTVTNSRGRAANVYGVD